LDLIEQVAWRVPAQWMDRLRRLGAASHQPGVASTQHLVEPLTARERDVLRFLPSRLTLGEIADELYVSVNTLKFHLKLIYRKLGVNSRAEASEYARTWARGRNDPG
jgi:LuxR family maltose regulon positive regulatory protein